MNRQSVPHVNSAAADLVGVSAFAFQGTNAHILLSILPAVRASDTEASVSSDPQTCWQRTRFWLAPKPHCLLPSVLWAQQQHMALFEACLSSAAAGILWQHQVCTTAIDLACYQRAGS